MDHYIAVTEIHDRPDTSKPTRVTKAGKPIELSAKDAADLGAAVRKPTGDEVKIFGLGKAKDEPKAEKPAAKAEKPAAKAKAGGDDTPAGGDDTAGMV